MWVQVISMMDQQWINDVLLVPPLPPLAAPDYFLLELAPPPLRKRDRDKQTETEKRKSYHENCSVHFYSQVLWPFK